MRLKYAYEHSTVKLPGAIRVSPYAGLSSQPAARRGCRRLRLRSERAHQHVVAGELKRHGFRVTVLKGGVPEWLAANFPIETKEAPRASPPEPGSLKG